MANVNLGNTLSDAAVALIRETVNKHMREYINTKAHLTPPGHLLDIDDATGIAPEVYLARTPSGGIAGRSSEGVDGIGAILNGELCDIFLLDPPSEETDGTVSVQAYVYNFTGDDLPGNEFIMVMRDKYGTWFAVSNGGGGGGTLNCDSEGYGWVAGLTEHHCLRMTVIEATGQCAHIPTDQELFLEYLDGQWVSTEPFDAFEEGIDVGSSDCSIVFLLDEGVPKAHICGHYLTIDGGCDDGSTQSIYFKGGRFLCQPEGSSLEDTDCPTDTFRIKLECWTCGSFTCDATQYPEVVEVLITGSCPDVPSAGVSVFGIYDPTFLGGLPNWKIDYDDPGGQFSVHGWLRGICDPDEWGTGYCGETSPIVTGSVNGFHGSHTCASGSTVVYECGLYFNQYTDSVSFNPLAMQVSLFGGEIVLTMVE